jgi:hypothetical protein
MREESPDNSMLREKESGSSSALMALINGNLSGPDVDKQTLASNLMSLLQLPPEKLVQLTSSIEKNLLTGLLINIFQIKSSLFFCRFIFFLNFRKRHKL